MPWTAKARGSRGELRFADEDAVDRPCSLGFDFLIYFDFLLSLYPIGRKLCRHWWASAHSPPYLRSRSAKRSAAALSGDQGMIVWWSIGAGVHVEPHSHANEQIVWMLKGKMEFRLGSEQRVCGPGDVVLIPGGTEHEAWFREDTEVIDFFAPPRDDFLVGGKPAYMSEG
jgi:quercetin dioxygenase-like cupin family protein